MARDARWPFVPFLIVRSVQFVMAFIVLALGAYVVTGYPQSWAAGMGVFIGIFSMIWLSISFFLLFAGLLLPICVVVLDSFCLLFYLITMAGCAASGVLGSGACEVYSWDRYNTTKLYGPCVAAKGAFAILLLGMFGFIATVVVSSIILHRNRKDLRGKKHAQGLPPLSSSDPEYNPAVQGSQPLQQTGQEKQNLGVFQQQPVELGQQYQQQPVYQAQQPQYAQQQPQYYQQPQQPQQPYQQHAPYPQTEYVDPTMQAGFVPFSPSTSPLPELMTPQPTGGNFSAVSNETGGTSNPPDTYAEMPHNPVQPRS